MSDKLPSAGAKFAPELVPNGSPNSFDNAMEKHPGAIGVGARRESLLKVTRISSILTVLVSGVALFSDGYNAQISESSDNRTKPTMRLWEAEADSDVYSWIYGASVLGSVCEVLSLCPWIQAAKWWWWYQVSQKYLFDHQNPLVQFIPHRRDFWHAHLWVHH